MIYFAELSLKLGLADPFEFEASWLGLKLFWVCLFLIYKINKNQDLF